MRLFVFCLIVFFAFNSCKKEESIFPKDYPYLITNPPVRQWNSDKIELSADIVDLGVDDIIEYGFILRTYYGNVFVTNYVKQKDTPKIGSFSNVVSLGILDKYHNTVQAYMKTNNYTVYSIVRTIR